MKLILFILFTLALYFCINSVSSQNFEYKKDIREQSLKYDALDMYGLQKISNYDLVKALEMLGVHIRKFPLAKFDKVYDIVVNISEYQGGVKIREKEAFRLNNEYYFMNDTVLTDQSVPYWDYIDQMTFFLKEEDDKVLLTMSTYSTDGRYTFKKKKDREFQYYNTRIYKDTRWVLGQDIPLFVYASSWYDSKSDLERFCGIVNLSIGNEDTAELLSSSPHYYMVSYKVIDR